MFSSWQKGTVIHGDQVGRTLGFPSANLDPAMISSNTKPGVYYARVRIGITEYDGALYFGPRHSENEQHDVLEIHILNFKGNIYGQTIEFYLEAYIRPPKQLGSAADVIKQITADVAAVRRLSESSTDLSLHAQ